MQVPLRNIYYLLCYAWERDLHPDQVEAATTNCRRPVDLLARMLAEEVEQIIKRGLDRGYRVRVDERSGPAGKILLDPTVARGSLARRRVICERDELTQDIATNRILLATIRELIKLEELDKNIHGRLSRLLRLLPQLGPPRPGDHPRRVAVHRNNRTYRLALDLCAMILEHLVAVEDGSSGRFRDFRANAQLMGLVFESFVRRFWKREQGLLTVESARGLKWDVHGDGSALAYFPRLETDIRLRKGAQRVLVETKYYGRPLVGRDGARKLRSGHITQLYVYLENLRARHPKSPPPAGVLLYAQVGDSLRLDYRVKDYRVAVRSLDLNRHWNEIGEQLLRLAKEFSTWAPDEARPRVDGSANPS